MRSDASFLHMASASRRVLPVLLMALVSAGCDRDRASTFPSAPSETIQDAVDDSSVRLIYVPAYTYALDQSDRVPLTTTLIIHNVSTHEISIESVRYYDAAGALVSSQLDAPRQLAPLETLEFRQDPATVTGESGANFLVGWTGPPEPAPLVEALMVGHQGAGRLTFTSRGVQVGSEGRAARP